ncbi:MAG: hypothetical protein Alis3KO_08020 [Aliiglaciecola sp.]|uniref:hypothetical protein n=1 Tax=Aliiglaciecola sp. M165 TaxID=2593649 RepID=UPI00117E7119|nr:hypothetical protein [Aliiglaciecola sp. M165]TRY29383.1 hypothetical protein FM019_18470 [Aliiglaciecola sp. M165]
MSYKVKLYPQPVEATSKSGLGMTLVEFCIALISTAMAYFGYMTGMALMMVPCIVVAIGAYFVSAINLYFYFSNKQSSQSKT